MREEKLILSPSILAADFSILGSQIKAVEESGTPYLHIDVMDGIFVPSISFGMPVISSIRKISDIIFDVHLMIVEPERYIEEFVTSGADIITFHLEATKEPKTVIRMIRGYGKKVGISIRPSTPVETIFPYMDQLDMVLVMAVEPGFGGQTYLPETTERIKQIRKYASAHKLPMDIQVDGGIAANNISTVLDAGANVIVAGSAIFEGDIQKNINDIYDVFKEFEYKK